MLRHKGKKRKGVEKRGIFSNGVSVSERSEHANNRTEFGHWELDSMVSSRGESKGVFSTFIERKSRLYTAFVGKDRTANTMEQAIRDFMRHSQKVLLSQQQVTEAKSLLVILS